VLDDPVLFQMRDSTWATFGAWLTGPPPLRLASSFVALALWDVPAPECTLYRDLLWRQHQAMIFLNPNLGPEHLTEVVEHSAEPLRICRQSALQPKSA
jgi:hypothetical protein